MSVLAHAGIWDQNHIHNSIKCPCSDLLQKYCTRKCVLQLVLPFPPTPAQQSPPQVADCLAAFERSSCVLQWRLSPWWHVLRCSWSSCPSAAEAEVNMHDAGLWCGDFFYLFLGRGLFSGRCCSNVDVIWQGADCLFPQREQWPDQSDGESGFSPRCNAACLTNYKKRGRAAQRLTLCCTPAKHHKNYFTLSCWQNPIEISTPNISCWQTSPTLLSHLNCFYDGLLREEDFS